MSSSDVHVNDQDPANKLIKCHYCNVVAKGLVWLECHWAGTVGDISPCSKVPDDVKNILQCALLGNKRSDAKKAYKKDDMNTVNSELAQTHQNGSVKRARPEHVRNTGDSFLMESKKSIGRFLYENGIDFNAVNSPSFRELIYLTSNQIPTSQELKGWILKDSVEEMREYVNGMKKSWGETGCSILLDGWTDETGRDLVNVLVDSSRGTVYLSSYDISDFIGNMDAMELFIEQIITKVGIKNVVQIVTYSTSDFMKELGKRLMKKYRPIFWTISACCCIELMLEKIGALDLVKRTMENAKIITKFIHNHPEVLKLLRDHTNGHDLVNPCKESTLPFLTLENIVKEEENLKAIFLTNDSKNLNLSLSVEGSRVIDLVRDRLFWRAANTVVKVTIPLVRVMECINEKKSNMGYIYETIDQAKETIEEGFTEESQYAQYWKVIDHVWNDYLYSPLHSAGYFFNPSFFYSNDVHVDAEVMVSIFCCIIRSTEILQVQDLILLQLDEYKKAKGSFSVGCAMDKRSVVPPATWWTIYGGEYPALQKLAFRILSQTCDGASKFQLKRSLVETLLKKERTRIEQQRLSDMVFLHYNMQLQSFVYGESNHILSDEIDAMDEWIVDETQNNVSGNGDLSWMDMDG